MNITTDGLHINEIYKPFHVQSYSRKFRGQCGLLHHKCCLLRPRGACQDYSCGTFRLNSGQNGRIKTSGFSWLDFCLKDSLKHFHASQRVHWPYVKNPWFRVLEPSCVHFMLVITRFDCFYYFSCLLLKHSYTLQCSGQLAYTSGDLCWGNLDNIAVCSHGMTASFWIRVMKWPSVEEAVVLNSGLYSWFTQICWVGKIFHYTALQRLVENKYIIISFKWEKTSKDERLLLKMKLNLVLSL